jgi:hypothetical protein
VATVTPPAAPTATPAAEGLGGGAIAGIVIGILVLIGAIGAGVFLYLRRRPSLPGPEGMPPGP